MRKGSTLSLGVEEDREGEEGRIWLAKIKDDPVRLGGTMAFANQVFVEGWIVENAQYYLLLHKRGPGDSQEASPRAPADRHPPLLELIRLDSPVALVVDSKPRSIKDKPWVLKATDRALIEAPL